MLFNKKRKEFEMSIYPESAKEAVAKWDEGETIWSIEMGGLGPGYEQAIQLLFVEIMRDHIDTPFPQDEKELKEYLNNKFGEEAIKRTDKNAGGYSGAQVGAAKQLAYKFMTDGWDKVMAIDSIKDRHIQISNSWPRA
jgi:hypothetical protein